MHGKRTPAVSFAVHLVRYHSDEAGLVRPAYYILAGRGNLIYRSDINHGPAPLPRDDDGPSPSKTAIAAIEAEASEAWGSGQRAIAAEDLMVVSIPSHEVPIANGCS